ncbi:MAG: DEAD/DEAH box helicase, partial [Ilumatobacteraceae bacterium]|nr:DEAD/DEAH box helicase [Ilumatobacteraceae bacterium]
MASNASISFAQLGLHSALVEYLNHAGITTPFPIQEATIPDAIAGRDVLGRGRTGSGKTLAFALPLLTRLAESNRRRQPNKPRALILVPTRELANQVNEVIMP